MLIKLSAAALAAVGAKTADEFPEALVKLLNDTKAAASAQAAAVMDLQSALKTTTDAAAELKLTVSAQAKLIEDLTAKVGNPATLTEASIKTIATDIAKAEASKIVVEQIGSIGGAPATAAPVNKSAKTDAEKSFPDLVAAVMATGKSKPDAVGTVVKSHPTAHKAWLETGGVL